MSKLANIRRLIASSDVNHLGHDGKDRQKHAAPQRSQLQHVGIVDVQVGGQHRVEKQRSGRPQQIAQPFLFLVTVSDRTRLAGSFIVPSPPLAAWVL